VKRTGVGGHRHFHCDRAIKAAQIDYKTGWLKRGDRQVKEEGGTGNMIQMYSILRGRSVGYEPNEQQAQLSLP